MQSPHQSSIFCFVSTGQGAAAWITWRSEDVSWRSRTSSGSCRRRWNIVGTMWVCVTRWRSMSSSVSAAPQRSMSTTVWPK